MAIVIKALYRVLLIQSSLKIILLKQIITMLNHLFTSDI
jgi:hypothetical protein